MAQPQPQYQKTCKTCDATRKLPFPSRFKRIVFQHWLLEDRTKKQRKNVVQEFVKLMNALMNEGGGSVCVHADNPNLLGQFDELVDDRLRELIPDGSSFDENFERHFHSDKVHVIFRVKQRKRPVSIVNFKTKTSLNKGLVDPTHAEMRHFLQRLVGSESTEDERDSESEHPSGSESSEDKGDSEATEFTFRRDEEVAHQKKVFGESVNVQAKRIPQNISQHPDTVGQFVEFCWNEGKLPMYISAFSKLDKGGSVYFGLHEHKTEGRPDWNPVDEDIFGHVLQIVDTAWAVWQTNEQKNVYHVAKECDVPKKLQEKTGKYLCEGIDLTEDQRKKINADILEKVRNEMLWYRDTHVEFQVPVDVDFLKVGNTLTSSNGMPDLCVVKIIVKKFQGLSFFDRAGPESYKIPNETLRNLTLGEWLTKEKK